MIARGMGLLTFSRVRDHLVSRIGCLCPSDRPTRSGAVSNCSITAIRLKCACVPTCGGPRGT